MIKNLIAASTGSITNPVLPQQLGENPEPVSYLQKIMTAAVTLILTIGAIFFFFNLVFGAIQWISSGGDKEAVGKARGRVTSAIIGIVILFAVFAIMLLIETIFKVHILTLDIGKVFTQ